VRSTIAAEITSDGHTVWVNAVDGMCVARFGRYGIDVHRDYEGQKQSGQCLACTAGLTTLRDWRAFQILMRRHYSIGIGDEHMPIYIRSEALKDRVCPRVTFE
jgi:hypothetical protein